MRTAFALALIVIACTCACASRRSPSSVKVVDVGGAVDGSALSVEISPAGTAPARRPTRLAVGMTVCLVKADRSVACIGDGPPDDRRAQRVAGLPPVVEIALGATQACARTHRGEVWCWTQTRSAKVAPSPVAIDGVSDAVQLASMTDDYTCVRHRDGKVACWDVERTAALVAGVDDAVDIAMWGDKACATTAGGRVVCWTVRDPHPRSETPDGEVTSSLTDVMDVALGAHGACARRKDGRVVTSSLHCMTLSHGLDPNVVVAETETNWTETSDGSWVVVPDVGNVTSLASGLSDACAASTDGRVRCWGCADWSFLDRRTKSPAKPALLPGVDDAEEIAMGLASVCIRRRGDAVVCWGVNYAVSSALPLPIEL